MDTNILTQGSQLRDSRFIITSLRENRSARKCVLMKILCLESSNNDSTRFVQACIRKQWMIVLKNSSIELESSLGLFRG